MGHSGLLDWVVHVMLNAGKCPVRRSYQIRHKLQMWKKNTYIYMYIHFWILPELKSSSLVLGSHFTYVAFHVKAGIKYFSWFKKLSWQNPWTSRCHVYKRPHLYYISGVLFIWQCSLSFCFSIWSETFLKQSALPHTCFFLTFLKFFKLWVFVNKEKWSISFSS